MGQYVLPLLCVGGTIVTFFMNFEIKYVAWFMGFTIIFTGFALSNCLLVKRYFSVKAIEAIVESEKD